MLGVIASTSGTGPSKTVKPEVPKQPATGADIEQQEGPEAPQADGDSSTN